ncbi:Acb2/Tad1 domain-containing protein [Streptomyces sp. NPDC001780]
MRYDLNIENRFTYPPPVGNQPERYEQIRAGGRTFAELLAEVCPASPELTRAVNAVDEAVMLANAAIARHDTEQG